MLEQYHQLFIDDIRRRILDENWARIKKCLSLIDEDQVWIRSNENVNSIGNLMLHLRGNITQYISAGLFQEEDLRERDLEFDSSQRYSKAELEDMFTETMQMVSDKLSQIKPKQLVKIYGVQGQKESGIAILVHVTEHLSYHVGQITYQTKLLNNVDTGYYAGMDLNAKN